MDATNSDRPDFIEPISPPELAVASSRPPMDRASESIRRLEWQEYIQKRREHARAKRHNGASTAAVGGEPPDDLTGIALSGGGIRSATFALGVLQAFAHHDLLRRFDYLSTVSGGGYIGTSLTWLISKAASATARPSKAFSKRANEERPAPPLPRDGFGLGPSHRADGASDPGPFPYSANDPRTAGEPDGSRAEGAMLRYLRQHGNYLKPGEGITLTSIIVVLLRGIILNLLVWIPIVAAVMALLIWLSSPPITPEWMAPPFRPLLTELLAESSPPLAFKLMLALAVILFGLCVLAFVVYSLATYAGHIFGRSWLRWLSGTKYGWRRLFESWMRVPLWIIAVLFLLASVPFFVGELHGWLLGSSFSLIGLISGFLAFVKTMQKPRSTAEKKASWAIPASWLASFGAAFLLYGVLAVSYAFGWWAVTGPSSSGIEPSYVLAVALALALVTGYAVDLNLVTIHRFYRDRLMEAFLPDVGLALANATGPATAADSARLSEQCAYDHPVGPYHLINANLVLTESDERTYRLRGGDSFVLSPLYCGSNATGWRRTDRFMGNELTLPTAMAISGAAANPWTASGGVGVTRNPLVGMLMALMNLRLGFWSPSPNAESRGQWRRSCARSFRANHFDPGLKEVIRLNLREDSPVCLLSDGGHFENLGLYELVRRRLRLIVVCDGTADPDYAFADLQNAISRVWTDFGARIEFDKEATLQRFMPAIEAVYPRDVMLSECAYAVAQIVYADGNTGHLVYLTTALCKGLRLKILGYKGANRDFPDQSTADQFFDEEQFEAYRELGYEIADSFIRHDMQNGVMLGRSIRSPFYRDAAA